MIDSKNTDIKNVDIKNADIKNANGVIRLRLTLGNGTVCVVNSRAEDLIGFVRNINNIVVSGHKWIILPTEIVCNGEMTTIDVGYKLDAIEKVSEI